MGNKKIHPSQESPDNQSADSSPDFSDPSSFAVDSFISSVISQQKNAKQQEEVKFIHKKRQTLIWSIVGGCILLIVAFIFGLNYLSAHAYNITAKTLNENIASAKGPSPSLSTLESSQQNVQQELQEENITRFIQFPTVKKAFKEGMSSSNQLNHYINELKKRAEANNPDTSLPPDFSHSQGTSSTLSPAQREARGQWEEQQRQKLNDLLNQNKPFNPSNKPQPPASSYKPW